MHDIVGAAVRRAKRQTWVQYQREASERRAMLEGDYAELAKNYIYQHLGAAAWAAIGSHYEILEIYNYLRDIIKRTAQVYTKPPRRSAVLPSGEEDPAYSAINQHALNTAMEQALHYALATGLSVIRPWVSRGALQYQVLAADEFLPYIYDDDPTQLAGLTYTLYSSDNQSSSIYKQYYWDMTGKHIARILGKIEGDTSGYRGYMELSSSGKQVLKIGDDYPYRRGDDFVLPFIPVRPEAPPRALCNRFVGRDLFDATLRVAKIEAEKAWIMTNQSHKQIAIMAAGVDHMQDAQILDPAIPLRIRADGPEAKIEVLDLRTDASSFSDEVDRILASLLIRRGWSLQEFKHSADRPSAEAMVIANEGKQAYLAGLQTLCRAVEIELFDVMRIVWEADRPQGTASITPEAELWLDFADPYRLNPAANWSSVEPLLKANVLSVIDIMRGLDPELTRDEALEKLRLNVEDNRRAQRAGAITSILEQVQEIGAAVGGGGVGGGAALL